MGCVSMKLRVCHQKQVLLSNLCVANMNYLVIKVIYKVYFNMVLSHSKQLKFHHW